MKLNVHVSMAFKKLKPSEKPSFGSNVITALTPPPTQAKKVSEFPFPDLPVPLDDLIALNETLFALSAEALTGNHEAIAAQKNAVLLWNNGFGLTSIYINTIASGSESVIRRSGFIPTKSESTPAQKPGAVADFNATINGNKGAIVANSKNAVPGATAYVFAALPEEASVVYIGNTMEITVGETKLYIVAQTRKEAAIDNLTSRIPYNVSMYAINRAGSGPATASKQVVPQ